MATTPELADVTDPRRPIDRWLFSYSGDHVNPTNQLIHLICVPAILWSVTAALWIIPVPPALAQPGAWMALVMFLTSVYYWRLSRPLWVGMVVVFVAFGFLNRWLWEILGSANLGWLGLSVENAFEPCSNLAAAARVLATNYQAVARLAPSRDHAIATALSMYNTGDRQRGFRNGYVARVYASASAVIPLIRGTAPVAAAPAIPQSLPTFAPPPDTPVSPPAAAGWNTAARASQASLMVFGDGAASQKGQHP